MNPVKVLEILQELRVLPYFPNDESVMSALLRIVGSMCRSEAEVRWLVNRMTSGIYAQWPGPHEMRACFCCRFKPKDGVNAYSSVYPDGLPPDPTAPPRAGMISGPEVKRLPSGHISTVDSEFESAVVNVANMKKMPDAPKILRNDRFAEVLREITTAPQDRPETPVRKPKIDPLTPERRAEIQSQIDALKERK